MSYLKQEICLCFSWLYPQNLQLNFNFSFPLCEVLFIWQPFLPPVVLVSEFWVILLTLVQELGWVALSLNSLTCLFDRSKALHIFTALSSVKLSSLRSNSWSFPVTVKTILSLNIRSFSRKLHAAALIFNSVRNLSNGSWYGMFQNLWDSMTSLSRGLQYLSNASKTLSGLSLSHHLSK